MCSEKVALKRAKTFIFAADLIAGTFIGVSFSHTKCMGEEYLNEESCKVIY